MIKYLGSKRRLVRALGDIATASGAETAVDLFTGTTRVAQEFKRRGLAVTAVDTATYSKVLADTYIATDATAVDKDELCDTIRQLNELPPRPGYFTETFCERSRFFHPKNGARIDAIRDQIERDHRGSQMYPILLTALMLAADRVDSTTGVQMAYLKDWAPRARNDLHLREPELLPGGGGSILGDATTLATTLPRTDLVYLDPPYNQHRYFTNYHVWETLVRWDEPDSYGVACKRIDARDEATRSAFNSIRTMPAALRQTVETIDADTIVLSYNNESWVGIDDLRAWCTAGREAALVLQFDSKRYVGAQIGIHDPQGNRVGRVSHLRNIEYVIVAGRRTVVSRVRESLRA